MQSLLSRKRARHGMNDHAGFDVDFPLGLVGVDFKDAGIAPEAFDLDNVHESDLPQRSGKSLALFPGDRIVQHIENKAQAVLSNRLFQEELGAGSKAGRSMG